jgi:hypothetical protein
VALAHRHRRYGAGMIYLKLRQEGAASITSAVIETWRREYNEERPKKGLGGLGPAAYAKTLVRETGTVTAGL